MTKTWKYDFDIARYTREIEQDAKNFRAYKERGNVYFRKKEFDHAIADYNKAIELKPDFFLAYNNRGNVYMQTGQYALAIADYDKAIALKPDNGMPYNNRGFAFLLMGNLDAAEADIQASLRLNPDNIYAMNSMAEIHAERDNAEEACRWLHKAIEKGYNNWNYIRSSPTYKKIQNSLCFRELISKKTDDGRLK